MGGAVTYSIAVVLGLVLCFWGVRAVRVMVGLVFGGFLGYLGMLAALGATGSLLLGVLVFLAFFVLGAMIGFFVFKAAVSLIFGYIAASTLLGIMGIGGVVLALMLSLVIAAVVYVLVDYLLAAGLALTGSALIFKGFMGLGLGPTVSLLIALAAFAAGLYNQLRSRG